MSQTAWENLASSLSLVTAAIVVFLLGAQNLPGGSVPRRLTERAKQAFSTLASRIFLCAVLIPAGSFAANLLIALQHGSDAIPRPLIHDEFSYLLAADTFAHGRLTNPTPPMWRHFETPQELMRPTYMSKYPPGQGIALAIGQVAAGEPIVGVWLSTAAACAAIYWMLLGFVPPRWALLGGIVVVVCPELLDWSRVYWGGSVAVLGGALLLGGWGRLMRWPTVIASIGMALGLVILANSRPYEGLVLSVPLMVTLLAAVVKRGIAVGDGFPSRYFKSWVLRAILPAGIILVAATAAMGRYNFRITGHVLRMPIVEYARQYDVYPKFWFLPRHPEPVYRNLSLKWVALEFEKGQYEQLRTVSGLIRISLDRLRGLALWQATPWVLLCPLAIGLFLGGDRRFRWLRLTLVVFVLGLLAESFVLPHYAAPGFPLVMLLIVFGWERMSRWTWRGRAAGRMLAAAVALGFFAGAVMDAEQPISRDSRIMGHAALEDSVAPLQVARQLIFVSYAPGYSYNNEYVFNSSDIASSRIIWARSLGTESDRRLVEDFPGRQVWLLKVGRMLNLVPYAPNATGAIGHHPPI